MAYAADSWHDLFVAEAGASAALAGLIFVAVSINVERILKYPSLPGRAAETLATLMLLVFISTFVLVPGQSIRTLGAEILAVSVIVWSVFSTARALRGRPKEQSRLRYVQELTLAQLGLVPFVVAGASLLAREGGGLYWTVGGTIFALAGAAVTSWVLLVEILR